MKVAMMLAEQAHVAAPTAQQVRAGRPRRNHVVFGAVLLAVLFLFGLHARRYSPFLMDDGLISAQYSRRLLDGHGLTWSAGRPVEGYSNLLWVLALAAAGFVGVDLVVAMRVLGIAGMATAIVVIVWWFRPGRAGSVLPAVAVGGVLALTGSLAVWAIGGLEQPLLVALVAIGAVRMLQLLTTDDASPRALLITGLCFGLAALTRPDGVIFAVVACASVALLGRGSRVAWRRALLLGAAPAALFAAQMLFRVAYYGDVVPNTAYAKVALTSSRVATGYSYVRDGLAGMAGLAVPALAACAVLARRSPERRRILYLVLSLGAWCSYVVFIGGDIFPARRHLAVAVVFLALLAGEFWTWIATRPERGTRVIAWTLAALSLVALGFGQFRLDRANERATVERFEFDCKQLASMLGDAYGREQPLVAVTAAGCMPYYSGLPSLDLLGLNDWHIARHRPATVGNGFIGHELGDPTYAFARQPDIVVPCTPTGGVGCFYGDASLVALPEFRAQYQVVPVVVSGARDGMFRNFTSELWLRTDSPAVGVVRTSERIIVPGALFGSLGGTEPNRCQLFGRACYGDRAVMVASATNGALVAELEPDRSATFARLMVPPGRWRVRADASAPVSVTLVGPAVSGSEDRTVQIGEESSVMVTVVAASGARLDRVELERVG